MANWNKHASVRKKTKKARIYMNGNYLKCNRHSINRIVWNMNADQL